MTSNLHAILTGFRAGVCTAEQAATDLALAVFHAEELDADNFPLVFADGWLYQVLLAKPETSLDEILAKAHEDRNQSPLLRLNLSEFARRLGGELNAETALASATPIQVETKDGPVLVFNRKDAIILQFPLGQRHELSPDAAALLGKVLQIIHQS